MKKVFGVVLFLAVTVASGQEILGFPTPSGTVPGETTVDGSSQYVDMTGWTKVAIHIEYDAGVTGTVLFECVLNTSNTPSDCGTDSIPFPGTSNLAATYVASGALGKVRVTFSGLAGTDSTHKVRASILAGR
jgi:hypothetical protein